MTLRQFGGCVLTAKEQDITHPHVSTVSTPGNVVSVVSVPFVKGTPRTLYDIGVYSVKVPCVQSVPC